MDKQVPNFNEIVQHLLLTNSQVDLEQKTGVSQVIISRLNSGKPSPQLTYKNGAALMKEYKKHKGKAT